MREDLWIPDRGLIRLDPRHGENAPPARATLDGQTAIGNTATCAPGVMTTVLDLRGDDAKSHVITLALFNPDQWLPDRAGALALSPLANPTGQQPGFAFLEFGAGGASAVALVDIGQVIAIPCSSLRVSVVYAPVTAVAFPTAPAQVRIGAFASYQPIAHGLPPTLTIPQTNIGIGGTGPFQPVGPFCRGLNFYRFPSTADYLLQFADGAQNVIGEVSVPTLIDPLTIAVPGLARFWRIVNGAVAIIRGVGIELLAL